MDRKTIMLIAHNALPIPNVDGGAIETLITHLLNENEKQNKIRLIVTSEYDEDAAKKKYNNSKVYYYNGGFLAGISNPEITWKIYNLSKGLLRKIFHNRISSKFFKSEMKRMNHKTYQLYRLVKKTAPDALVVEVLKDFTSLEHIIKKFGVDNCYLHLHGPYTKNDNVCNLFPNTISISKYVRDWWTDHCPNDKKDHVLYNCVDIDQFCNDSEYDILILKKELGINKDDLIVLFCGRLIPEKGISELLDAFDYLVPYPIVLIMIGSENFSKGNSSGFSKQIVTRAEGMENVRYLGYVPNETIAAYYAIADIQVVPSVWQEGAGIVAIEGMASGLPLIITRSGGMTEYVDDACAIKLPIDNYLPQNIAKSLLCLYKDESLRLKMGAKGKETAKQYSVQNYYKNFVEIFNKT